MAHARTVIVLLSFSLVGCAPSEEPPTCAAAIASGDVHGGIAVDDEYVYALGATGMLRRAPLGDELTRLEDFTNVGLIGSQQIVVDDTDLWIDGQTSLARVDKQTGAVEIVDPGPLVDSVAFDGDYVYWVSNHTYKGVVRRPKRGGVVEVLIPTTDLYVQSITVTAGRLYLVANDADDQDAIYRFDFASRELASMGGGQPDTSLALLGPDEVGRQYLLSVSSDRFSDRKTTTISRYDNGQQIATWQGSGLGADSFVHARDGLYLGVPELDALVHVGPDGERDVLLSNTRPINEGYRGRVAIGADAIYVSEGRQSVYKLPLDGGLPLCQW